MRELFSTKEDAIDFLVKSKAYPVYKNGKVFFIRPKENKFFDEVKNEIIKRLNLKTQKDCENIRKIIKERAKELRATKPIKEWFKDERPREMLIKYGAEKLPLAKLLAIILRTGDSYTNSSAEDLAKKILNEFKTLRNIDKAPIEQLCSIPGVGIAKATQLKAALEIGKRLYKEKAEMKRKIRCVEDAIEYATNYYAPYLRDSDKEFFNIILLDASNRPIENPIEISKGFLTSTIIDPKEIIREAIKKSTSSLILIHNHPSGDVRPSQDDINATRQIIEACELLGIKVLDHIILGKNVNEYFSFLEEGLIK